MRNGESGEERDGAVAPANSRASRRFRGLEQFHTRGDADGVGYCIAGSQTLRAGIFQQCRCHLFAPGRHQQPRRSSRTITKGRWCFWARARPFIRASAMCACARTRCGMASSHSTIAGDFQGFLDDRSIAGLRRDGSCNNIRSDAIKFLARYVRERLRRPEALQALELQFFALGTYVETMRQLDTAGVTRRDTLSDQEFSQALRLHRAKSRGKTYLRRPLPGGEPAAADRIRQRETRTGRSPYNLVIEKRIERARNMLPTLACLHCRDRVRLRFFVAATSDRDAVAKTGPHAAPAAQRLVSLTRSSMWSASRQCRGCRSAAGRVHARQHNADAVEHSFEEHVDFI